MLPLPYRDENPTKSPPVSTLTIILVNVAIFVQFGWSSSYEAIVREFGFVPSHAALPPAFTSMFLHADLFHLIGNMWYLWLFGDNVEDRLRWWYPFFYIGAGLCATLIHLWSIPAEAYEIPTIGASGAISGVLGAYMVWFPRARIRCYYGYLVFRPITVGINALLFFGAWFLLQLVGGSFSGMGGGIAYGAHIGGFLCGVGIALCVSALEPSPTATRPSSTGPAGALPTPQPATRSWADARQEVATSLHAGDGFAAVQAYRRNRRRFPYDVLEPDRQLAIARLLEEQRQSHLAVDAYRAFLKRYALHQQAAFVHYRLGSLYAEAFRDPGRAIQSFRDALRRQALLANADRADAQQRMEQLETHLQATFVEPSSPGSSERFTILQETSDPIRWHEVGPLLARLRQQNAAQVIEAWRTRPGFLLEGIDGVSAHRAAEALQHLGLPVLVVAQSRLAVVPPAAVVTGGSWQSEELRLETAGAPRTVPWSRVLLLSCCQLRMAAREPHAQPMKDAGQYRRILEVCLVDPAERFRIDGSRVQCDGSEFHATSPAILQAVEAIEPSAGQEASGFHRLVEEFVRAAPGVSISDGVHAILFGDSWETATFDTLQDADRYHEWQLQLAWIRRAWTLPASLRAP